MARKRTSSGRLGLVLSISLAIGLLAGLLSGSLSGCAAAGTTDGEANMETANGDMPVLFENVRVFDGESVVEADRVLIRDGIIEAVGTGLVAPDDAEIVDGTGHTLLPGLIDGHTHSYGDALERAVLFGVTTAIDMFTDPATAESWRSEQRRGVASHRADIVSAGFLATAPGGHGTQYGIDVPTLTEPGQAAAWVEDRVAEGSEFIKIVLEDGSLWGRPLPALDEPIVAALVREAHRHDRLAVAHVTTFESARQALSAQVDGFVHLFRDRSAEEGANEAWVRGVAESGVFVTPTLTVLESSTGNASGAGLATDARFVPFLRADETRNLNTSFTAGDTASSDAVHATLEALVAAGVPILAGTDAPNPGTSHGASMHRELELLVEAAMSPVQALAAATSVPAAIYGLSDRGRIAPGLRADLLLVEGDPTRDILATRSIAAVWKEGVPIDRTARGASAASTNPVLALGPISDFDNGDLGASSGSWQASTDQIAGGGSAVDLSTTIAEAGSGSLRVSGEIRPGFAYPWAGAMYFPAAVPMEPVDASAAGSVAFRVRADHETTLRLMIFTSSLGLIPSQQAFSAGPDWRTVEIALDSFPGAETDGLQGLLWSAGPAAGPFGFELDDVELRLAR